MIFIILIALVTFKNPWISSVTISKSTSIHFSDLCKCNTNRVGAFSPGVGVPYLRGCFGELFPADCMIGIPPRHTLYLDPTVETSNSADSKLTGPIREKH